MNTVRRILRIALAMVAGLTLSACASTQTVANQDTQESETELQLVTGSRIKQDIDPESESPATRQPVRVVDRDELDRTGSVNLGDALRKSVPQIGR